MNYIKIYERIIESSKNRIADGYTEKHHILPRCMGGGDEKENIAVLTAREHFICHWLLYKHYRIKSLAFAWHMMKMNLRGARYTSRSFKYAKEAFSKAMTEFNTGRVASDETRRKQSIAKKGCIPWNKGIRVKHKKSQLRIDYDNNPILCKECREPLDFRYRLKRTYCSNKCANKDISSWFVPHEAIVNSGSFKKGHEMECSTRGKISKKMTGMKRPRGACPNCGKEGALSLLKRWHFDNCKEIGSVNS